MVIQNISLGVIRSSLCHCLLVSAILLFGTPSARADAAFFDLTGPRVNMKVDRAGRTLPISEVPNLQAGDRLWIHADLPEGQQGHYLLIAAFLRGSTNPPPDNWFTKSETWNKKIREEGTFVTVPPGAQQALLFLAPETGGDFSTLRSTVRRKPGVFVRASQDLNQASLYRLRLDKYLNEVKETSQTDPKELHDRSVLLARTLGIKLDPQCFDKPEEQQAPCLTQNSEQLVLDDGHSQSMVAALTSGPSTELVGAISATPMAGGGFYSAYVGAIVDVVKLMGNFRSAEYQYIPALALPKHEELNLRLNNPPSFHNPKSVLVVGLPAVEAAQLPPLRPVDADQVFCVQQPSLTLPVEGAPLVFSTDIAHDFFLRLPTKAGGSIDLPATPDPTRGGFVIDTHSLDAAKLDPRTKATLHGRWGFESYEGPNFRLQTAHPVKWTVPPPERNSLIVDRADTLHLESECAVCVDTISVEDQQKKVIKTAWKFRKPDQLELLVPLNGEPSGPVKIMVKQFGLAALDEFSLFAYSEAARLDTFAINAGDRQGVLKGTRLDEVDSFELNGIRFVPAKLSRANQEDELHLAVQSPAPSTVLEPEQRLVAHVSLKDGRVLDL